MGAPTLGFSGASISYTSRIPNPFASPRAEPDSGPAVQVQLWKDGDLFFSTVFLLFVLGYGLFCIFCPIKVTEHAYQTSYSMFSKYFYGTVFSHRVTGFLAVTMVILVVVSQMLAA